MKKLLTAIVLSATAIVSTQSTGKLKTNITIKKALVNTKAQTYSEPTIIK